MKKVKSYNDMFDTSHHWFWQVQKSTVDCESERLNVKQFLQVPVTRRNQNSDIQHCMDILSARHFTFHHVRLNAVLLLPKIINWLLKGHSGAELHIYFLVHLESIYYEIFFYSKIVPNCAVAK